MSHPAESSYTSMPIASTMWGRRHWTNGWGDTYYGPKSPSTSHPGWVASRKARSASTNNPKGLNGWRRPGPYSGFQSTLHDSPCRASCEDTHPAYGYYHDGTDGCLGSLGLLSETETAIFSPLSSVEHLRAKAQMKMLGQLKEKRVDLSVAFAERKKSAVLVQESALAVLDLLKSIRRLNPRATLKALSSVWLAYRYAWLPTLMDVEGSLKAIEAADNGTYDRYWMTARGTAKAESSSKGTSPFGVNIGGINYPPINRVVSISVKREVKVRYDVVQTSQAYRRLQDVGCTDVLSTAWELIPFSFVADWFVGAGDFLDAVNSTSGWSLLGASETVYESAEKAYSYTPGDPSTSPNGPPGVCRTRYIEGGGSVVKLKKFTRTCPTSFPFPSLLLKEHPLNMDRTADSIALLSGFFTGIKHR